MPIKFKMANTAPNEEKDKRLHFNVTDSGRLAQLGSEARQPEPTYGGHTVAPGMAGGGGSGKSPATEPDYFIPQYGAPEVGIPEPQSYISYVSQANREPEYQGPERREPTYHDPLTEIAREAAARASRDPLKDLAMETVQEPFQTGVGTVAPGRGGGRGTPGKADLWKDVFSPQAIRAGFQRDVEKKVADATDGHFDPLESAALGTFNGMSAFSLSKLLGTIGGNSYIPDAGMYLTPGNTAIADEMRGQSEEMYARNRDTAQKLNQDLKQAAEEQPFAYGAGEIGGNLALMGAVGGAVGAVPGMDALNPIVRAAVTGGATMGGSAAIRGAGEVATGGMTPEEYGRSIVAGALGGAAGGAASAAVANAGLNLLRSFNKLGQFVGAQNKILPNILLGGFSSAAYGFSSASIDELSKAVTQEDYSPDWGQIKKNTLTAAAFGAISYTINLAQTTAASKEYLNSMNENLRRKYELALIVFEDSNASAAEKANYAEQVILDTENLRNYITNLHVPGGNNQVSSINDYLMSVEQELFSYMRGLPAASVSDTGMASSGIPLLPTAQNVPATVETPTSTALSTPSGNLPQYQPIPQQAGNEQINETLMRLAQEMANEEVAQAAAEAQAAEEPIRPVPQPQPAAPAEIEPVAQERPQMQEIQPAQPSEDVAQAETPAYNETVEEAKQELRNTIRMPVKGTNAQALYAGAENGDLTMNSVTMGANVPGFTPEQRYSLAQQIIEGSQTDAKQITAKVPDDGTFTVNNGPAQIAKVLNGLNVKANQESIITKELDRVLKSRDRVGLLTLNGEEYATNGYLAYPVGKDGADYVAENYKAQRIDFKGEKLVRSIAENDQIITAQPYDGTLSNNTRAYIFDTPDGRIVFDKKMVDMIDNGTLHYGKDTYLSGKQVPYLVSVGDDGHINGFLLGIANAKVDGDLSNYGRGKLKSIKNAAVAAAPKEGVKNGGNAQTVGAGRADVRGRDTGAGGLPTSEHEPEAAGSISVNGQRGNERVPAHEGSSGETGARGGRSDAPVRLQQGEHEGSTGTGNEESVSGVEPNAGSRAGVERSDGSGRVSKAETEKPVETKAPKPKPQNKRNFRITEDIDSKRPNFNDNFAAIKLLKELMQSGRKPTAEEMATLAKFKGWGGLKDILNEYSYYGNQLKKLLTPEEYAAAKLSTLNAHYTSTKVISAMYDAVKRLGFTGGRVLEPSMGVGNFFGMMPEKLARASELYGVELDSITGNIAKLLYPDAKIDVAGFQDVLYPDNTFDLVIGNVPFSDAVKVPYRGKTYNLHDFFFIKALDETRPGGIAALITSVGTLDKSDGKTKKAIADRANLIAAYRLPDDTFKVNAGTGVTTDLIFLQKKGDGIEDNGVEFQNRGEINGIKVNEYYVANPKNILGSLAQENIYGKDSLTTVVHGDGTDIQTLLAKAFKTLPKDIMNGQNAAEKPVTVRKRGERSKPSFTVGEDGKVTITDSKTGEVIEYGNATKAEKEKAETVRDYIGLKNTFLSLLETENNGGDGSALREKLNEQYDSFVKKHGALADRANKRLLSPDGDYIRTTGIEVKGKDGYGKSDIFRVPTVSKTRKTHADTAEEALSIVLNEDGKVNVSRMAKLTDSTAEDILKALKDEIILTPDGDYQLIAQYASGNIYQKLDQIKDKPGFERQRKILEDALPRRRGADEIEPTIGSHWIGTDYVRDFIRELFNTNATVKFSKELGQWNVSMGWSGVKRFSTDRVDAGKIVEATLNGKNIEVYDKDSEGKRILNEVETKLAQAKQDDLREAFRNWAFKDKARAEELIDTYNRTLNAYAPMNYAALADRIDFGVNPNSRKQPRDYQKTAAARIVFGGNTLLHNGVGTGKTLTMIIAAHAMKQAGIAQKPMFVVPNGKVEDFRSEILEAYPDAKILALDNDSMTPKQIQSTKSMIATGDWDYVIIYHSAFGLVPLSPEMEAQMLQRQLDIYEQAARDTAGERNGNKRFEKGLQARMETLRNRIKKVLDRQRDDTTYFDDMGIDALFLDEAHNFKKVGFQTTFNFSGIVADTNDKTTDLYMKEEYMRDRGGRIVLATATPITNAISEMYNMAMHVAPEVYRDAGIYSFDTWANTFVNIESQPEIASDGKTYRRKERARNFKNANALFGLYRQFADIKQTKDVVKNLPEAETITVKSEGTDLHKQILSYLSNLPPDKILQMNNDGKAAASDLRLVTELLNEMGLNMTPDELDLPGSKINKAVSAIVDEYQKSNDIRGTQFVFLDSGMGNSDSKRYRFNLYNDLINKLVKAGIPKDEIAKIQDYDGEDKRQILYEKMNSGKIRVLIGSTAKMGEGVNAQERAVALHHLSVPYRPDNLEQREGRIVRSGNINKKVRIYRYIQEESYDSYLWQMIERKAAYLAEAYNGGDATEVDELSEAQVNAREAKAIATGNPLIVEKMNLQDKISRLKILYRGWQGEQYDAQRNIEKSRAALAEATNKAKNAEADQKTYADALKKAGGEFIITVGNKTYDNRKDAADALAKQMKSQKDGKLGEVYGLEFGTKYDSSLNEHIFYVRGKNEYFNSIGDSPAGNITRITNLAEKGPVSAKATAEKQIKYHETAISDAQQTLKTPFKQKKELDDAQARMRQIDAELGIACNVEGIEDSGTDQSIAQDKAVNVSRPEQWTAQRVGSTDKKPMGLSEIIEKIRHDFGLNITTGHIRGSGVLGQYNPNDQGIRTRIKNDLPTVAHELGHHFERVYDITGNMPEAAKKEIVKNLDPAFAAQYKEEKLPREGVAEFLRRYLQNSETAAFYYPEFTKYFLNTISGPDAAQLMALADEVNAYYSMDADTAQSSVRLREEGRPDARTVGEKIRQKYHNFYQAWVDSNHGIKLFEQATGANVYKFATNAAYADARAGAAIIGNLYDIDGAYVAPGLKSCFAGHEKYLTDKALYKTLGEYLIVKHGPERLKEGLRVFADDRKNSTAWMQRRQTELEQEHPELVEITDRLYEFLKQFLQTWGVDTGLVSQETADEWLKRWIYYVPLCRAVPMEARGIGAKRGFANQTSTIHKAVGSGLDIIHPVDSIITNIVKMVNAGIRNGVMQRLTDAADQNGDATFLEKVPMPVKKKTFDMRGVKIELKNKVDESGITDATEVYDIIDGLDDILKQYGRGKAYGDVVTVLKNGSPQYWKINDPLLLQSITNMAPKKMEGILDAYAQVSRFMMSNITGNNIIWSLFSNFPRDLGTFFTYSKVKNPVRAFASMGSAYVNKFKGDHADPIYMEYLAMGGGHNSAYTADRDLAKRAREKLSGKVISANPLDWIAFMSDTIEMGPRFATYKMMRENGMTPEEAFYEAMDVTTNFRRGGRVAREVNKVVPFFNAGVQGLDKHARWITADDAPQADRNKVRRGRFFGYLAVCAAIAAVVYFLNNLDEESEKEYQQLSNYTKNSYWNIRLGDGKYFAIPKPHQIAVLSSFFETCMEYGIGKNDHAFDEFYDYVADTCLPNVAADLAKGDWQGAIGSLGIIGVGAYLMANRDFLGKPIESAGMQYLEPRDRYNARTSKIAYAIGQALNVSPQKVDYFFSQVLGGWWKSQKALFPVGHENVDYTLGVQNTYIKDNQYSTDIVNRLYDMQEKSAQAKKSHPDDIEKAIAAKRDSNMTEFYSNYNKLSKNESGTAARSTRQTVLDMILEYEKAAEAGTYTDAEKAVLDIVRKTGEPGTYMPAVMNTYVKDGKDELHTLSDVQYVEYQVDYLRLYYEIVEDSLPFAKNDNERAAIVKHAKDAAKNEATARVLGRIGAPKAADKYGGVSEKNVTIFTGLLDIADDDGSLKQDEVIAAIQRMQRSGLSNTDAYKLFHSRYDSDKNNPWAK